MNKSALIGISALIGGLAIYKKTFKTEYEAEVFMADRVVAIRANKITPLNPKYTNLQKESYNKFYHKYTKSPLKNLYGGEWQKLVGIEGQNTLFGKNNSLINSYLQFTNQFRNMAQVIIHKRDTKILIPYNTKLKLVVISLANKIKEIYDSQQNQGKGINDIRKVIMQNSRVQRGVKNYFDLISEVLEKMPNARVRTLAGYQYGMGENNNFITNNQANYSYNAVFDNLIDYRNNFTNIDAEARGKIEKLNYQHINFIAYAPLITEYTEADVKDIEKNFKNELEVGIYASTLDWMDFLKANPSVKTIGRTGSGEFKYYDTVFKTKYDAPKQLNTRSALYTQVLDVALFEKAFSPAHLEEMIRKLTKEQNALLTKAIQKNKRQGNRKEVLEQQIIEPNKKIITSAINKWFSEYDNIIDKGGKNKRIDFYLYLLSPRYEGRYEGNFNNESVSRFFTEDGKNLVAGVKIQEITKDNKGIYKKTDKPLRNYRVNNLVKLINVDDIQVPSTLKTDAKPRYKTNMQKKIDRMESKLQEERDKLKQSEIKFNNAKREMARIEKIL